MSEHATPLNISAHSAPSSRVMTVDPELAQAWLDRNQHNRGMRWRLVAQYARDMSAGRWQLTGEPVKFDHSGNLLDGQHRLQAVVEANAVVPMLVVWGLSPATQQVMDTGAKRTTADALGLAGHHSTHALAATARLCMEWEEGRLARPTTSDRHARGNYTHTEILAFIERNDDLPEAVNAAMAVKKRTDLLPSVMGAAWWRFSRINPVDCGSFFSSLVNNITDGVGDPRHTLLSRLAMARRTKEPMSARTQMFMVCRTWNAWRTGEHLHLLKTNGNFPDPI